MHEREELTSSDSMLVVGHHRHMPQNELDEDDSRDMESLNGMDHNVRKHTKVVEILERRREHVVRWNKDWDAKERQRDEEKLCEKCDKSTTGRSLVQRDQKGLGLFKE